MLRRIATILLSSALGGSLLFTGSTGATAAVPPTVDIPIADPLGVTLARKPVPITITVKSNGAKVTLRLQSQEQPSHVKDLTGTASGDTWTFHTTVRVDDPLGFWTITPTATGADGSTTVGPSGSYGVYAPTRFVRFTAHPHVVRKGGWIYASGRLQAMIKGRWRGLGDQKVDVRFNDNVSVTTDRNGDFRARLKARISSVIDASFQASGHFEGALSGHTVGLIPITVIEPKKR